MTVRGPERGLGRAAMMATTAGKTANLSNTGGSMGATAAREAARERMVREAASGRGRRGRQHFTALRGQRHLLAVAVATRAMVDMTTAPTAKTAATKRVVVSPITPATRGRRGGEYVSTRTHPLTPHPAYTPNPTLPLGLRGDPRDPRAIASDSPLEPAECEQAREQKMCASAGTRVWPYGEHYRCPLVRDGRSGTCGQQ